MMKRLVAAAAMMLAGCGGDPGDAQPPKVQPSTDAPATTATLAIACDGTAPVGCTRSCAVSVDGATILVAGGSAADVPVPGGWHLVAATATMTCGGASTDTALVSANIAFRVGFRVPLDL